MVIAALRSSPIIPVYSSPIIPVAQSTIDRTDLVAQMDATGSVSPFAAPSSPLFRWQLAAVVALLGLDLLPASYRPAVNAAE
jgi:hypothetical protein